MNAYPVIMFLFPVAALAQTSQPADKDRFSDSSLRKQIEAKRDEMSLRISAQVTSENSSQPSIRIDDNREIEDLISLEKELSLNHWQPDSNCIHPPKREFRNFGMNVFGNWTLPGGFGRASLFIDTDSTGQFQVQFRTSGCTGGWAFRRTARYSNGVLTFDRPVQDVFGQTYYKMYAVLIGKSDYLLPANMVEQFESDNDEKRQPLRNFIVTSRYLYSRKGSPTQTGSLQ